MDYLPLKLDIHNQNKNRLNLSINLGKLTERVVLKVLHLWTGQVMSAFGEGGLV